MGRKAVIALILSALMIVLILVGGALFAVWRLNGSLSLSEVEVPIPQYPVPKHNTADELLAAAKALEPDRNAIAEAYNASETEAVPAAVKLLARHDRDVRRALRALSGECLLARRSFLDEDKTYWTRLRTLARMLSLRARLLQQKGKYSEALAAHLQVLRLGDVLSRNGGELGGLTGVGAIEMDVVAFERCIAPAAAHGEGKGLPGRLEALYAQRMTDEQRVGDQWAIALETLAGMDRELIKTGGAWNPGRLMVRSMMGAARREQGRAALEAMRDARRPYWERTYEPRKPRTMMGELIAPTVVSAPSFARSDATLRGLRLLAAVELYRAEHGELPPSLDALVPAYLKSLPPDPFSGSPFGYRVAGRAYRLYSVGPDRRDDGGRERLDPYTHEGDIIIWPPGRAYAKRREPEARGPERPRAM